VNYYDKLEIRWEASADPLAVADKDRTWYAAGTSANLVYLTFDKPTGTLVKDGHLLQTMVDIGSRLAVDSKIKDVQTDPDKLLEGIWKQFAGRELKRAKDGEPLKYYGKWNVAKATTNGRVAVVQNADGQCTNWSQFFLATVEAQGLKDPNKVVDKTGIVTIEPTIAPDARGTVGFMIKSWGVTEKGKKPRDGEFPYLNKLQAPKTPGGTIQIVVQKGGTWTYNWDGDPEVEYQPTANDQAKGQSNDRPQAMFPNHEIVQIGTTFYDPSYGKQYKLGRTLQETLQQFQDEAVAGFYSISGNSPLNVKMKLTKVGDNLNLRMRGNK
jgi:hypothetical protein